MEVELTSINYLAVGAGAIGSMILGALWYGPLFGNKWMEIVGVDPNSIEERKEMQKRAGPLYFVQFLLTLFQVLVLAHLIAATPGANGIERALWIWAAFVIPTLAGAVMWTNENTKMKWARFLIQGGYQITMFLIYGLLLHFWK